LHGRVRKGATHNRLKLEGRGQIWTVETKNLDGRDQEADSRCLASSSRSRVNARTRRIFDHGSRGLTTTGQGSTDGSSDPIKPHGGDRARRFERGTATFNAHDIEGFAKVLADDVVFKAPGGMHGEGKAACAAFFGSWFTAFPDAYVDVQAVYIMDDVAVEEGTFTGTHNGGGTSPMGLLRTTGSSARSSAQSEGGSDDNDRARNWTSRAVTTWCTAGSYCNI
jgi:hypothetical protein